MSGPRIGSLCSGYGGIDLAVEQFFGARTAWHCEYEPGPSKILAHHWDVPNHHDLTAVDWDTVEPVDILTAGWPCQPWSVAGAQKGIEDERAIWPGVADAIRRLRPRHVVLENVPAIVVLGELARAVGDLASLGYDSQWQCLRASDIGAPHRRERCFILASDTDSLARAEGVTLSGRSAAMGEPGAIQRVVGSDGAHAVTDPEHPFGWTGNQRRCGLARQHPVQAWHHIKDSSAPGSDRQAADVNWGPYRAAIERWEAALGRPAPAPTEPGRNGQRLSPLLVEWMMGLPAGWVTDPAIGLTRNEQLKALGNGVVPQQALAALDLLSDVEIAA
ncbi:DNA cytosine methyltransferase [Williamsia phyllosphaerae]